MATSTSRRHVPRTARGDRARRASRRRWSTLLGNGAFVLLGVALLTLGGALIVACQQLPASTSSSPAGTGQGRQTSTAPEISGAWIPLHSSAAADVIAAAKQSSLFQQSLAGSGDQGNGAAQPGTPVLVRVFQPAGTAAGQYPDFYVVPMLNASGAATDAAELALNPSHTAIQVIAIVTYTQPHADGVITRMTAEQAVAAVSAQQHAALRTGTVPELVYFPADAAAQEAGQVIWNGGGEYPADPIWLVPGADGRDHLVGVDGRAYYPEQLPMVKPGQ